MSSLAGNAISVISTRWSGGTVRSSSDGHIPRIIGANRRVTSAARELTKYGNNDPHHFMITGCTNEGSVLTGLVQAPWSLSE